MQLRAGMGRRGSGGLRGLFSEKGWECLCVMLVSVVELWAVDKTHDCWRGYTAGVGTLILSGWHANWLVQPGVWWDSRGALVGVIPGYVYQEMVDDVASI